MFLEKATSKSREPRLSLANQELLISCGIDPQTVNPSLFGRGFHHKVYRMHNSETVLKIPIHNRLGIVSSAEQEAEDIDLYKNYFREFSVPTTFLASPLGYCVLMDYVQGRQLTTNDVFVPSQNRRGRKRLSPIGEELARLIEANNTLTRDTGKAVDLVGLDGTLDAVGGAKLGRRPQRLANVLVVDGHLKLIDYDLMTMPNANMKRFDQIKAVMADRLNSTVINRNFTTRALQ